MGCACQCCARGSWAARRDSWRISGGEVCSRFRIALKRAVDGLRRSRAIPQVFGHHCPSGSGFRVVWVCRREELQRDPQGCVMPEPVMELCWLLPGRAPPGMQPCVRDLGSESGKQTELSRMCRLGLS